MNVLITGGAGFIGSTLGMTLLERGDRVTVIDNLNDYYDVSLKESRLERLNQSTMFRFLKMDIADRNGMADLFSSNAFDVVVNLAAQAGVRYSIENPAAYVDANLVGFGKYFGGLSPLRCGSFSLRVVEFCLWFEYKITIFRTG